MSPHERMVAYMRRYAENTKYVSAVDILYDIPTEDCRTAQEILDECARQSSAGAEEIVRIQERERRLRILASIIRQMESVGLIS